MKYTESQKLNSDDPLKYSVSFFKRENSFRTKANLGLCVSLLRDQNSKTSFVLDPKLSLYTEIIGKCIYSYRTKKSTQHFIKITALLGNCLTVCYGNGVSGLLRSAQGNKIGCNFPWKADAPAMSWSFCSWCLPPRQTQVHTSFGLAWLCT